MKIIEPSFSLSNPYSEFLNIDDGIKMLRFIEKQARISHRSEDRQTEGSWNKFIRAVVLDHGDYSVIEHAHVTGTIRTDRGVSHEIVRHRIFSYTQESTRFVRYKGNMEFIKPVRLNEDLQSVMKFEVHCESSENLYKELLDRGGSPQEARSILPNSLATTIAVTGNLRAWRWFFLARTTKETHIDFRRFSVPMLEEFKKVVPILFDDIEPNVRQIDNAQKAH
jgi:thymidylate synthase (FAD)